MIIPNLAIHMNRKVNEGIKINPQTDTLPLVSIIDGKFEKDGFLLRLIAEELDIKIENILDFELFYIVGKRISNRV